MISSDMKYVIVEGPINIEVYIFSNHVTHGNFVFANGWSEDSVLAAGFIDADLTCHGSSHSLQKSSRPQDTDYVRKAFRK